MVDKRVVFGEHYLDRVLLRVDVPRILELEKQVPSEFQKAISDDYPFLEDKTLQHFETHIKKPGEPPETSTKEQKVWVFQNKDRSLKIEISSEYFILEQQSGYERFSQFIKRFLEVWQEFLKLYPVKATKRLGLRYINKIDRSGEGEPFEWDGVINSQLTAVTDNFLDDTSAVTRSMQLLEFKFEDCKLRFQFGQPNSAYPDIIAEKVYFLDLDCYTETEEDITNLRDIFEKFNRRIFELFYNSIGEKLRKEMKEVELDD